MNTSHRRAAFWAIVLAAAVLCGRASLAGPESPGTGPRPAIAMHGEPLYAPAFENFAYANPDAPKGGTLIVGELGSFDSLNSFIVQGTPPEVSLDLSYWVVQRHTIESLMMRGQDEPFTLYGLLANTVETPEDRSWVEFILRDNARFSDGSPVTVDDVIFSWQTLKNKGVPNMRRYYGFVAKAERRGDSGIRFVFADNENRELPLILGLMPILSRAYYSAHEFSKSMLEPPLGSGPYVISEVDAGRSITFTRDPDYWGADLAVNRGQNNFDVIRYEYFRDSTSLFEAFTRGDVMLRFERNAKTWATGYDFPAATRGDVVREALPHGRASGMYGFVFNTRRPVFADRHVRDALTMLFDFEWLNEHMFFGSFERIQSYFDNSDLSSHGRPASPAERALLAPFPDAVTPAILEAGWTAPIGGTPELERQNKRAAMSLLADAGWVVENGQLVSAQSKTPFNFEILLQESREERIALAFAEALKDVGIVAKVRLVDGAQFQQRRDTYDFDMMPFTWGGTLSPGNEQAFRFGSAEAAINGTYNLAGVQSPAVDALIARITNAVTRDDLVTSVRALDRVLLSGAYVIPLYYQPVDWWAYWASLKHPDRLSLTGTRIETWWHDSAR